MAQYDGSIRINTEINTKDVPSQLMKLENSMQKAADKVSSLRQKMESLKDVQIPTQEYAEIQKQIEATEKKINDLVAHQEKFIATGGKESSSTYQKMQYDLDELRNSIPYLQGELQDLADAGKAFTLGTDTEQYSKLGQELKYAENNLLALNRRHDELIAKQGTVSERFSKMQNSAKKAFNAVTSGTKKSSGLLSTFASRLKGLALSLLIFNWISKAFNAMISGMKQGFTNFMNYSDSFANSVQGMKNAMSTLGNQFAAAFAPIVQMIIPWLTKLVSVISTAMTYVAQFIAILGGKNTFVRAKQVQDSYNKSLGGTASAAKKAYGALAKFDDLDVLQKKEDDTAGGAGDAAGDMFEEVPVDSKFKDWLDGILEKLKPILDYLNKLKDIFMEGFWDGLGDWEYRLDIIKNSLSSIKDSLIEIWTDPAVLAAADKWAQSVAYMIGSLVGSIASIGLTIAANLLGGIASYLEDNKGRIKNHLISMFDVWSEINYMLSDFFQSFAYVFEAFASESGIQLTANLIGIFADAFMGITELASKLGRDLLEVIILPFTENKEAFRTALEGFLGVLAEVTGTIKQGIDDTFDKLNEVYDTHFKPFFDSVANGLSDLVGQFLDFWNGKVQPILAQLSADFDDLWTGHIQPLINNVAEFLGKIVNLLKLLWENILQPLISWIISNVLPKIFSVINSIWNILKDFIGYVADFVSDFITLISGVIDFLTGIFSSDFDLAYKGLAEIASGFVNALKDLLLVGITLIANAVVAILQGFASRFSEAGQNIIQGLIDGILSFKDKVVDTITNIANSIIDWFKEVLGISSPSTVMAELGSYIIEGLLNGITEKIGLVIELWNNLKENTVSIISSIGQWFIYFWTQTLNSVSTKLQSIQKFFSDTWTAIYKSTSEVWTNIQEWFSQTLSNIQKLFTDIWSDIQNWFTGFWNRFTASLYEIWENIVLFFSQKFDDIKNMFNDFMEFVGGIISTGWTNAWNKATEIFDSFKAKIESIVDGIKNVLSSFFSWISDLVSDVLSAIGEIGSAASTTSSQVGNLMGGTISGSASYSEVSAYSYNFDDVPHLASGSVIRGGNPFVAMLGDQPRGQTNVEAPAGLIKDMVAQGIAESGIGGAYGNINADMTLDGETFARLMVPYVLNELGRCGYNVEVLGVT